MTIMHSCARFIILLLIAYLLIMPDTTRSQSCFFNILDATAIEEPDLLQPLSGRWEFQPWSKLDQVPDFNKARPVNVPGHNLPGAYRTEFTIIPPPVDTVGTVVHFGAVGYRCRVYVNGRLAGSHLGGFTPFAFDITELLKDGGNQLVVLVQGRDGTLLNPEKEQAVSVEEGFTETGIAVPGKGGRSIIGYGYFAIEGIRQPVHIRHIPAARIAATALMPSYREQKLKVRMTLENQTGQEQRMIVKTEIFEYDIDTGEMSDTSVWTDSKRGRLRQGKANVEFRYPWVNPRLWMLGDPHLYVARFSLLDPATHRLIHQHQVRFGFREIWTEGNRILLNGMPIRGFVHGTLDTRIPPAEVRSLFRQLLATNINMVRPATMPPPPHYATIADEKGIGLVAEGELTFNRNYAYEQPAFWENFERVWKARIHRDKNHPSILIWSLGNEVMLTSPGVEGLGRRFFQAYQTLRELDPTRPFMQEGDGDLRDNTDKGTGFPIDIINMHFYNVSPVKNPLWATEFPPVAWAMEDVTDVSQIIGSMNYGAGFPDRNRPWFIGEFGPVVLIAYPDHFAFWTGPDAYRDLFGEAKGLFQGAGETMAMQIHAFRDLDMAAMDPWAGTPNRHLEPYLKPAMNPVLVFTRDWRNNWFGGDTATRDFTILNDSLKDQRLHVTATLEHEGRLLNRQTINIKLPPGEKHDDQWEFFLPAVNDKKNMYLTTTVYNHEQEELSSFTQDWQIFSKKTANEKWRNGRVMLIGNSDPLKNIAEWGGVSINPVEQINNISADHTELVIIDFHSFHALRDSLKASLDKLVEEGGVVLIHEADIFNHDGIEVKANFNSNSTRVFDQDPHPLTAETVTADWQFWRPDHFVSQANFAIPYKPGFHVPLFTSGAGGMRFSPLLVKNHGLGAYILSRLRLNSAVTEEPVARIFLNNAARLAEHLTRQHENARARQVALLIDKQNQDRWRKLFRHADLKLQPSLNHALANASDHVLFMSGNANPSANQMDNIHNFVQKGGILWLHRLTPETPFLDMIDTWIPDVLTLRPSSATLPQFEINTIHQGNHLLDGITDYHTCWITFAWTHGDRYSIRTTPIADYAIRIPSDSKAILPLLIEPDWIGEWQNHPGGSTIAQELMFKAGQHRRHDEPAAGLTRIPIGNGVVVIDQLKWDTAIPGKSVVIPDKARHYLIRLSRNLVRLK